MESLISEENARKQFDSFLNFYDVDLDLIDEDGKIKEMVERKLIKAIQKGKVEIDDSSEEFLVRQKLRNGDEFVYHELDGRAKIKMDTYKGKHERLYGLLAVLSKQNISKVSVMSGPDLAIAEYISMIFLAG